MGQNGARTGKGHKTGEKTEQRAQNQVTLWEQGRDMGRTGVEQICVEKTGNIQE